MSDSSTHTADPPPIEAGMATSEYAVGTLGAACIGCVVFRLLGADPAWLTDIFDSIRSVLGWLELLDPTAPRYRL